MLLGHRLQRDVVEARAVFFDYDLVDLGLRLEHSFSMQQTGYLDMHRKHLANLADLPRQGLGVSLTSPLRSVAKLRGKTWRLTQLEGVVRRLIGIPHKSEFIHYGDDSILLYPTFLLHFDP